MAYEFEFARPLGGVKSVTFPKLTWGMYKQLKESDGLQSFVETFVSFATPALSSDALGDANGSDYENLNDLFVHMTARLGEWKGGQFKLTDPLIFEGDAQNTEVTALTFDPATLGDLYDYYALTDENERVELFMLKFGRCVGETKAAKAIPLSLGVVERMAAKDVIYIREKIAGKSQGGSASWKVVADK